MVGIKLYDSWKLYALTSRCRVGHASHDLTVGALWGWGRNTRLNDRTLNLLIVAACWNELELQ